MDACKNLSDSAVQCWETSKNNTLTKIVGIRGRHPRRYAIKPHTHFLSGVGPWNLHPGEKFSMQVNKILIIIFVRKPSVFR